MTVSGRSHSEHFLIIGASSQRMYFLRALLAITHLNSFATIMCRNDELSLTMS